VEVFILIIMLFYPSGKYEHENRPVEVPVCKTVDGVRTEDSSCGVRACLKIGRETAAKHWGNVPGMTFSIICNKPDGTEAAKEGTEAGGGHPALGFK
jgi:hypothetical protein